MWPCTIISHNSSTRRPTHCPLVLTPKVSFQEARCSPSCSNLIVLKVFSLPNPDLGISKSISNKGEHSTAFPPLRATKGTAACLHTSQYRDLCLAHSTADNNGLISRGFTMPSTSAHLYLSTAPRDWHGRHGLSTDQVASLTKGR